MALVCARGVQISPEHSIKDLQSADDIVLLQTVMVNAVTI